MKLICVSPTLRLGIDTEAKCSARAFFWLMQSLWDSKYFHSGYSKWQYHALGYPRLLRSWAEFCSIKTPMGSTTPPHILSDLGWLKDEKTSSFCALIMCYKFYILIKYLKITSALTARPLGRPDLQFTQMLGCLYTCFFFSSNVWNIWVTGQIAIPLTFIVTLNLAKSCF